VWLSVVESTFDRQQCANDLSHVLTDAVTAVSSRLQRDTANTTTQSDYMYTPTTRTNHQYHYNVTCQSIIYRSVNKMVNFIGYRPSGVLWAYVDYKQIVFCQVKFWAVVSRRFDSSHVTDSVINNTLLIICHISFYVQNIINTFKSSWQDATRPQTYTSNPIESTPQAIRVPHQII